MFTFVHEKKGPRDKGDQISCPPPLGNQKHILYQGQFFLTNIEY